MQFWILRHIKAPWLHFLLVSKLRTTQKTLCYPFVIAGDICDVQHFLYVDALMFLAFFLFLLFALQSSKRLGKFYFSWAHNNGIAPCGMIKVLLNWKFRKSKSVHELQLAHQNEYWFLSPGILLTLTRTLEPAVSNLSSETTCLQWPLLSGTNCFTCLRWPLLSENCL